MTDFKSLLEKFKSQEVFIHKNSVIQIVDMKNYSEAGRLKTDFIYHTERNRRGIITIEHEDRETENLAIVADQQKNQLRGSA